jgi:signal transduction histidine kinase
MPLNFVSKSPCCGDRSGAGGDASRPLLAIDPGRCRLLAANAAGRDLWGLERAAQLPLALDRTMPALSALWQWQTQPRKPVPAQAVLSLTFWTRRGTRVWPCLVSRSLVGGRRPAVEVAPILSAISADTAPRRGDEMAIAIAAHEVKTPLAAIQAFADVMLETRAMDDPRLRSDLVSIRQAARHGLDVVEALLGPGAGAPTDVAEAYAIVELETLAREAAATLAPLADRAGARVVSVGDGRAPRVFASRLALTQVLLNLVSNALRHAGAGPRVEVRTGLEPDGTAWLEVADDGDGIPAAVEARVLERAPHLPPDAAQRSRGGLGLVVSRALAATCGGVLSIGTDAGGGARVRVSFAADRSSPSRAAPGFELDEF